MPLFNPVVGEILTFTPVLSFGGASVGITYGTQEGQVMRVGAGSGAFCIVRWRLELTSKGSSVGTAAIAGLPIASQANFSTLAAYVNTVAAVAGQCHWQIGINSGNTTMFVQYLSNATGGAVSAADTDFTNTTNLWGSGIYACV